MRVGRQYVNKAGEVRWFPTDTDLYRDFDGVIFSRIPTFAKIKSQLAYASEAAGEEINLENSDIGVAVPDGEGSFCRVRIRYNQEAGEWEGLK